MRRPTRLGTPRGPSTSATDEIARWCRDGALRRPLKERAEDIEPNLDFELERYARLNGERVTFNREARERYLTLLRSGGNDHPMTQLKKAGVDLSEPGTVSAIVEQLDGLVTKLETELNTLAPGS